MSEPIFDHEKRDVYRLSIEYVAGSYGIAKALSGANRQIRDQWLRAAQGKSRLKRIVSMLARLIQRTGSVARDAIEYESEYRDAEYEQDPLEARTTP